MEAKILEVRDGTFTTPVLAVQLSSEMMEEQYLLARAGYRATPVKLRTVLLHKLTNGITYLSPNQCPEKNVRLAYEHVQKNWDSVQTGDVICCEYLRGERQEPSRSTRLS